MHNHSRYLGSDVLKTMMSLSLFFMTVTGNDENVSGSDRPSSGSRDRVYEAGSILLT